VIRQQRPSEGWGPLVHNRYRVDIDGSPHRGTALRDVFRRNVAALIPLDQVGPVTRFKKNQTFTVALPLGGALPMRVEDILPGRIVCATLEGHPLAGLLTFDFVERGPQVRFEIGVHARLAPRADAVLMAPIDGLLQALNWTAVAERLVDVSGGRAPAGVQTETIALDADEVKRIEDWAESLAIRRLRGRVPPGPPIDGRRRAVRTPVRSRPARPTRARAKARKGPKARTKAKTTKAKTTKAKTTKASAARPRPARRKA
jgi:hypothetical protein